MNKLLLILLYLFLSGCSPSEQEKKEIAIIACNIMGESRAMDASMRIREINSARDEAGEVAFLEPDEVILEAFQYNLCEELVLNDPEYTSKLNELKRFELVSAEEREEAEKIARVEREEAERTRQRAEIIAREEREEAERMRQRAEIIAREEPEERIAREEAERISQEAIISLQRRLDLGVTESSCNGRPDRSSIINNETAERRRLITEAVALNSQCRAAGFN